jgi:hypothetical protein
MHYNHIGGTSIPIDKSPNGNEKKMMSMKARFGIP